MNTVSLIPRYNIRDLPNEKLYVVTLKLSVCTESSGCEANHTIFENMMLPKQPCSWDEGFVNTSKHCAERGITFYLFVLLCCEFDVSLIFSFSIFFFF